MMLTENDERLFGLKMKLVKKKKNLLLSYEIVHLVKAAEILW